MSEPEEIGFMAKDGRTYYFILEDVGEVYKVHEADFQQFLTRFARGCNIKDIEKRIPEAAVELDEANIL